MVNFCCFKSLNESFMVDAQPGGAGRNATIGGRYEEESRLCQ